MGSQSHNSKSDLMIEKYFCSLFYLFLQEQMLVSNLKNSNYNIYIIITLIYISETEFRIEPKCLKFCWSFYMKSNDFLKVNKAYRQKISKEKLP